MNNKEYKITGLPALLIFIAIIAIFLIYSVWTDNCLEYAIKLFFHKTVNVPYWLSVIISFIGNGFILVFNIVMQLLKIAGV